VSFNGTNSIVCPDVASTDHWYIGVIVLACFLVILIITLCIYLFREHLVIRDKKGSRKPHIHQLEGVLEPGPESVGREHSLAPLTEVEGRSYIGNGTSELPSPSQQDLNRISRQVTV
jgi:hypothetical protein